MFSKEGRIEINGLIEDVLEISLWGFDVLEVSNRFDNVQSTGVVVYFLNSIVVKEPIKIIIGYLNIYGMNLK